MSHGASGSELNGGRLAVRRARLSTLTLVMGFPGSRSDGDAVRGVEENLLKLTRQVTAPHQAGCGGQRAFLEADGNHVVAIRRLIWLVRF